MTVEKEKRLSGIAPAAGCFGFAQARDRCGEMAHTNTNAEGGPSDWERYAARFRVVDYGDGQPVKESQRTS